MHGDTAELFADHLTLASVDASANVNAEFSDRVHNCPSAADRTRWTIEGRQEAVASSIDFATSMPGELVTNKGVMLSEKVLPSAVPEFDKPVRRLDNVREQDGREYAITLGFNVPALPGQESFNLSEDRT
jgi:hypothetical protein